MVGGWPALVRARKSMVKQTVFMLKLHFKDCVGVPECSRTLVGEQIGCSGLFLLQRSQASGFPELREDEKIHQCGRLWCGGHRMGAQDCGVNHSEGHNEHENHKK